MRLTPAHLTILRYVQAQHSVTVADVAASCYYSQTWTAKLLRDLLYGGYLTRANARAGLGGWQWVYRRKDKAA